MAERVVTLGGQQYAVKMLPMKRNAEWRKKLAGPFGQISQLLEGGFAVDLADLHGVAEIVRGLSGTLIGSIDILMDLLFDYSPELAADRERIEEEAFDDEAMAAFVEVLRLAYPFEMLMKIRPTGQGTTSTSPNSRAPNGKSPKKS